MAYVPVPKDLTKVKTKVAFNLTKRQLVCFGCGALIGVPLFFLLRGPAGNSVAAMCMMLGMAQTLNYLSEHGLLDYADLETKTAEATARYNALSDQIKAAEKRMAEIAVLRTHIVNYAKTRDTYVAYRKAGYSKKFRQEHEEEILLHQAAKEAFNELNVKKLPTIKELQTEYAQLLADKKKAYGEYRQARAAMRELLTVKNNVDRVLAMEQVESQQKEKDHGQR